MLGAEMMMKNMLKAAGIDPQVVIEQVTQFVKEFVSFVQRTDARSEELLARIAVLEQKLDAALYEQEQTEGANPLLVTLDHERDKHAE